MKKTIIKVMATVINFCVEETKSLIRRPIMGIIAILAAALQIAISARFPFAKSLMLYGGISAIGWLAVFTLSRLRDGNLDTERLEDGGWLTKRDRIVGQFDRGYTKPTETIVLISIPMKVALTIASAMLGIVIFSMGEYDAVTRYFTEYHASRGMVYAEYLAGQNALQWMALSWLSLLFSNIILCDSAEIALLSMETCNSKLKILRSTTVVLDATFDIDDLQIVPEVPKCGSYREMQEIFPRHERMDERYYRYRKSTKNRIAAGEYVPEYVIRDLCLVSYAQEVRRQREEEERRNKITCKRRVG